MITIFLGAPGVGKGTQGARLAQDLGWAHVSTGDLLRAARREGTELGKQAQKFMDAGDLVPDGVILDMVREHLQTLGPERSVVFDGFPRTVAQAEGLAATLTRIALSVDRVIVFEADDEQLVKRISGRRVSPAGRVYNIFFDPPETDGICNESGEALVHRADDQPDTVRRRLVVYRELTEPLIDYYEGHGPFPIRVDGEQSPTDVQTDVRSALGISAGEAA
jgi:adenylate kinase